jgi:hypothetical protein
MGGGVWCFSQKKSKLLINFVKIWSSNMGGYGSGRPSGKQKAEEYRSLDVNRFHREGKQELTQEELKAYDDLGTKLHGEFFNAG